MRLFANINNAKRMIMITESQAMDLLFEAATIQDIYQKYYSHIPQETFQQIISADPTYNPQNPDKMGRYGKWLLALYQKNNLGLEDLHNIREYLSTFIRFIGKIEQKDIMKYESPQQLYSVVEPFLDNPQQAASKSEEIRNVKKDAEKVYEDSKWMVIVPHTKEASCYYGKNTKWCTAAEESENMFDRYNKEGLLYINILKGSDTKYQFHFETESFMDAKNDEIKRPVAQTIGLTPELVNFYTERYDEKSLPLTSKYVLDNLNKVKGLEDYYVDEDLQKLLMYDKQRKQMIVVYELEYYDEELCSDSRLGRFIPIYGFDQFVNMFDIKQGRLLFNERNYQYFYINGNNLIMIFENGQKGIYSLEQMRYTTTSLPENCTLSRINAHYYAFKPYSNDLAVMQYNGRFAPFSFSKGNVLSDRSYRTTKKETLYSNVNGKSQAFSFVSFIKGNDEYHDADILLYDGTLVPMPQLAQNTDEILRQHMK